MVLILNLNIGIYFSVFGILVSWILNHHLVTLPIKAVHKSVYL